MVIMGGISETHWGMDLRVTVRLRIVVTLIACRAECPALASFLMLKWLLELTFQKIEHI